MAETEEKRKEELAGFRARVFQHEVDHLYGLSLLNFSVSDGDIDQITPRDQSKFLEVKREYLARFKSNLKVAEERYLSDEVFKKKIDKKIDGVGIETVSESIEDYVANVDFEAEMTRALEEALKEDEIRAIEEAAASKPSKSVKHT